MLLADIKIYFIEQESTPHQDEIYLGELEQCKTIEQLIQVVAEYYQYEDWESANYILVKVST